MSTSTEGLSFDEQLRARFVARSAVVLDPFQKEAIELLEEGRSVLVAAPTGSGKTLVAEYAVERSYSKGLRSYYTAPIKALSNQKYNDLRRVYGDDNLGLLTGDVSLNPDAPIVVMTTEVLRNMTYDDPARLSGVGCVVLDEVHYLEDRYRGSVWEEIILTTPRSIALVCLSATVSNAEEFARWVESVRGDTAAVIEERRPIRLEHRYCYRDRRSRQVVLVSTFDELGRPNKEGLSLDRWRDLGLSRRGRGTRSPSYRGPAARARRFELVEHFAGIGLLPAIYFIFSRAGCDEAVRQCFEAGVRLTAPEERRTIREIADASVERLSDHDLEVLGYRRFLAGLEAGLAPHHAGMVPPFREAVEQLFERALIKVVFATETLALGINMPARSVVIETLSKYSGEGHVDLTPGEYTQLTGRAGRRGIDEVGYAVVQYSPFHSFAEVASLASTRSQPLRSSFRPTYNMVANLVRRYDQVSARRLVGSSFAQFLTKRPLIKELDGVVGLLEERGYLAGWRLTTKGERLRRIYHDCDLLLCETLGAGLFDGLEPPELAALCSLFVFEPRRADQAGDDLGTARLARRAEEIEHLAEALRRDERRFKLPPTRSLDAGFGPLALAWARGEELSLVLRPARRGRQREEIVMPGGDFVRNIKQLVDLLRQIATVFSGEALGSSAGRAVDLLVRGVVEASTHPGGDFAEQRG